MDAVNFLDAFKAYTDDVYKDLLLPQAPQESDPKPPLCIPRVYKMRLDNSLDAKRKAPYVIHTIITSKDQQPAGQIVDATMQVRSIFCAYCRDEQEGALYLLRMIERLRLRLLEDQLIGDNRYALDLQEGLEYLIYPDDTAPFYAGEMVSTWHRPRVQRRIRLA